MTWLWVIIAVVYAGWILMGLLKSPANELPETPLSREADEIARKTISYRETSPHQDFSELRRFQIRIAADNTFNGIIDALEQHDAGPFFKALFSEPNVGGDPLPITLRHVDPRAVIKALVTSLTDQEAETVRVFLREVARPAYFNSLSEGGRDWIQFLYATMRKRKWYRLFSTPARRA